MEFKVSVENTSEINRTVQVIVSREALNERVNGEIGRTAKQANIKGFRPGKAPRTLIEKMYGGAIRDDVLETMWKEGYESAVKQHDLKVVELRDLHVDREDEKADITVKLEVSVVPEPVVKDYRGVSAEAEVEEFVPEMVEAELKDIRRHFAKIEALKDGEAVAEGDYVSFSVTASCEGNEVAELKNDSAFAEIGRTAIGPELTAALQGMKLGEEKDVTVHFPDDHDNKTVAGKDVLEHVKVTAGSRAVLPEMDDELAKKSGIAETAAALKEEVEKTVRKRLERRNQNARYEAVVKAISEKNPFEVPSGMVDEEIRDILFEVRALDPSKQESYRVDVSRFREGLGSAADFRVRRTVILRQIVKQEKIEASDEDCNAWIEREAAESGMDREAFEKNLGIRENKERLNGLVIHDKVMKMLLESATISEKKAEQKSAA